VASEGPLSARCMIFSMTLSNESTAEALRRSIENGIAAGELLIEAKAQLRHGQWLPWLQDNCNLSERTAQLYMRLAKNRADGRNGSNSAPPGSGLCAGLRGGGRSPDRTSLGHRFPANREKNRVSRSFMSLIGNF
jgi:hypothetical protein